LHDIKVGLSAGCTGKLCQAIHYHPGSFSFPFILCCHLSWLSRPKLPFCASCLLWLSLLSNHWSRNPSCKTGRAPQPAPVGGRFTTRPLPPCYLLCPGLGPPASSRFGSPGSDTSRSAASAVTAGRLGASELPCNPIKHTSGRPGPSPPRRSIRPPPKRLKRQLPD
jgi:hypothetical protein